MKLAFTLFLFFVTGLISAQEAYDVIHLKDGSFYKGNITEYNPDNHATIILLDGRVITVKDENISSLNVVKSMSVRKNFDVKSKGYYHNSLVGPQFFSNHDGYTQFTFAYNMVNGYMLNGHNLGLGLGLENHINRWYAPVYADYSYHFLQGKFRPMAGINGGFMIPLPHKEYISEYYKYNYDKGSFVGGRIGFTVYTGSHFAFLLNLTYRYIHLIEATYVKPGTNFNDVTYRGTADLHRIGVMIGFVIN